MKRSKKLLSRYTCLAAAVALAVFAVTRLKSWFPSAPEVRWGLTMAYDRTLGSIVLFGGILRLPSYPDCTTYNDPMVWNGTNWSQLHSWTAPPERCAAYVAFDEVSNATPDGLASGPARNDSWVFTSRTAEVTLTPANLTFPAQPIGTTSGGKKVAIKNTGNLALEIHRIATTEEFAQTNDCGSTVAPDASCTFDVSFRPTNKWLRTGALYLYDNAADSPQKVSFRGQGTVVAFTASSLNFGNQALGATNAPQSLMVTNTGTAPLKNLVRSKQKR